MDGIMCPMFYCCAEPLLEIRVVPNTKQCPSVASSGSICPEMSRCIRRAPLVPPLRLRSPGRSRTCRNNRRLPSISPTSSQTSIDLWPTFSKSMCVINLIGIRRQTANRAMCNNELLRHSGRRTVGDVGSYCWQHLGQQGCVQVKDYCWSSRQQSRENAAFHAKLRAANATAPTLFSEEAATKRWCALFRAVG